MSQFRPIAAVLLLWLVAPATHAQAHGGEAAISTFPAQAPAGGEVTVFGEDLQADAPMQLYLLTAEGELLLAEPRTDEAGHFSAKVTLPDTLSERTYELRLTATSGVSTSTFVTVVGSESGVADGSSSTSSDWSGGLLTAAVLALAGIGLLVLALRPRKGLNRARG